MYLMNNETFIEKELKCRTCGNSFIFTAGEQKYYRYRNLNEPTHCPTCRKIGQKKFQDKKIVCKACGQEFDFLSGEQRFYHMKNLVEPKFCPRCRRIVKGGYSDEDV